MSNLMARKPRDEEISHDRFVFQAEFPKQMMRAALMIRWVGPRAELPWPMLSGDSDAPGRKKETLPLFWKIALPSQQSDQSFP